MTNEIVNEAGNQRIKPIILVDRKRPQFFNFDQGLVTTEKMVEKILPVSFRMENHNGLISATTSEISASKLRINVPKQLVISEGDQIRLDFSSMHSKLNKEYFLKIPYEVLQIDEFSHAKHLILALSNQANAEFVVWFKQWLKTLVTPNKYEENNDKIFNTIFSYYKRLYCIFLPYPIIFSDPEGIKHAFLSNEAVSCIDFSDGQRVNARLSVNAFNEYINDQKQGTRIPLYVWYENDEIKYLTSADLPKVSPKQIIAWLKTKEQWRVLLIRTRKVKVPDPSLFDAIQKYASQKLADIIDEYKTSFTNLTSVTNILDISNVFENIDFGWNLPELQFSKPLIHARGVSYSAISFKMKRVEPRFSYNTRVRLETEFKDGDIVVDAETIDISLLGLSLKLPYTDFPFTIKDQVLIEFVEWNQELGGGGKFFKKKQQLSAVEYTVKNVDHNGELIFLGLARNKRDAEPGINQFITDKLVEIKRETTGVRRNELELYNSFHASVWLTNNIAGLPFFLGHDAEGIRIIQAIGNTEENEALRKPFHEENDWSFLQQIATTLSVAMRDLVADKYRPLKLLSCGVYCYYEEFNSDRVISGWKTKTDLELTTPELKKEFIEEAMRHSKRFFYHCSLVSVKGYKDDILNAEVVEFMSKAAHRVREMHSLVNSLIAVGELNDVTRLIEFMYKN